MSNKPKLNDMCKNCYCLGKTCQGSTEAVWNGCVYKVVEVEYEGYVKDLTTGQVHRLTANALNEQDGFVGVCNKFEKKFPACGKNYCLRAIFPVKRGLPKKRI